ncbi:hypothetical protein FGO68_gene10140 [Halteria grandinella]|uniref:Uncharacterized protein n=1 Tax=Halteria grandinella TaxID=5974 RepID=A0A8J8NS04_HALGN|nr:hypothetical protein FGO68_gene10140 [Halteria grandinella]
MLTRKNRRCLSILLSDLKNFLQSRLSLIAKKLSVRQALNLLSNFNKQCLSRKPLLLFSQNRKKNKESLCCIE